MYVLWMNSNVGRKEEFFEDMLKALPGGVRVFGGGELHPDGRAHYHGVFSFPEEVDWWADAAKRFSIEGDRNAIWVEGPRPECRPSDFLTLKVAYILSCYGPLHGLGDRSSLERAAAVAAEEDRSFPVSFCGSFGRGK